MRTHRGSATHCGPSHVARAANALARVSFGVGALCVLLLLVAVAQSYNLETALIAVGGAFASAVLGTLLLTLAQLLDRQDETVLLLRSLVHARGADSVIEVELEPVRQ